MDFDEWMDGDDVRVWFEGDPDDSPWEGGSLVIMQVRVLPAGF